MCFSFQELKGFEKVDFNGLMVLKCGFTMAEVTHAK